MFGNQQEPVMPPERTLLRPSEWPAGHRAALAIMVDLDPNPAEARDASPSHDEVGARYLFDMLQDFDVSPTVVLRSQPLYEVPVPASIGFDGAINIDGDDLELETGRKAVRDRLGTELQGVVMPDMSVTEQLQDATLWTADRRPSPFPTRTNRGNVVVPTNRRWIDRTWLTADTLNPPSAMLESWSLSLQSVRTRGELMVITITSHVAGHPGHIETVQRFLDEAVGAGDVWITNVSSVANHVKASVNQE